jgi:aminopeptidase
MLYNIDPRDNRLAKLLTAHSISVAPGDTVMVSCNGIDALGLASACMDEVVRAGGTPVLKFREEGVGPALDIYASEEQLQKLADIDLSVMKQCTAFIGIRASMNPFEGSNIDAARRAVLDRIADPPFKHRVNHTNWVVLRYPNASFAQAMKYNREVAAEYYYNCCIVDYAHMARAVKPLQDLMEKTDRVVITGPGTGLRFSIKGIPAVPCCGERNIPDGECFTAPIKDSVNGIVTFNCPTIWDGMSFDNIVLDFLNGKIIRAQASTPEQTNNLNAILDRDEGARFVGEFSFGFNPFIREPMKDILFDEKITGSFHMAMGSCYDEAPNGNTSSLHWDMVSIQRPEYGGGQILMDDVLVRENGRFVMPELEGLNPENFPA